MHLEDEEMSEGSGSGLAGIGMKGRDRLKARERMKAVQGSGMSGVGLGEGWVGSGMDGAGAAVLAG